MKKIYIYKYKTILIIKYLVIIFSIIFAMNYERLFYSENIKTINFTLGTDLLSSRTLDIIDGNVMLPFPSEIGIEAKAGEIFLGYDSDNDGVADYKAGETISVLRNKSVMNLTAVVQSDGIPFSAWLYDNNAYTSGTELTSGINDVSTSWSHDQTGRNLVIKPNFTEATGGTIEITLPIGMQLYGEKTYTLAGGNITDVTFSVLNDLDGTGGQGVGSYYNRKTGTLTYTFNELTTNTDTIVIPVQYDVYIWDKNTLTNTNFTDGIPPIEIVMTEGSNTYTKTLDDVKFGKIYSNLGTQVVRWYLPGQVLLDAEQSMHRDEIRQFWGYWESVEIVYHLPTKNGGYATYLGESSTSTANNVDGIIIDTSDPSKVVYKIDDLYHKAGYYYLAPLLNFSSEVFAPADVLYFNLEIRATSHGGKVLEYDVRDSVKVSNGAEINVYGPNSSIYKDVSDTVESQLGHISLANAGLEVSNKIDMEYNFDINNVVNARNNIDVTAVSLPQVANTTFTATYTLVDKNNNIVATDEEISITSGHLNTSGGIITIPMVVNDYNAKHPDAMLDAEQVNFKTIKYSIDSVPISTTLYVSSAALSNQAAGNFYGQYTGVGNSVQSMLTVTEYNKDGSVKKSTNKTVTLNPSTTNSNSLYVRSVYANDYSINAGEKIGITTVLNVHDYPYGTAQYVETPVLYFLAPKGIWVEEDTIVVKRNSEVFSFVYEEMEVGVAGQNLYSITVTDTAARFGGSYFDENGVFKKAGDLGGVTITFDIATDPSLDFTSEKFSNMLFTRDLNSKVSIHGQYIVKEPYDFENDGIIDNVVKSLSTSAINIYANTNNFEFENEISYNNGEYKSSSTSYILSDETGNFSSGIASYRVKIINDSSGLVAGEDFYHYIAVPKPGVTYPNEMNVQNENLKFSLVNEPIIYDQNGDVYDFLYTTSTDLVDSEGNLKLTIDDFVPIEEITNISDVTMIRVTGIDNSILRSNTKDVIEMNFVYEKTNLNDGYDSGKKITFNSYGWQKYLDGGAENTGNEYTITNSVSAQIRYITNYEETVLVTYEDTNLDEVSFSLPAYFENKEMHILGISEYNLNLVNNSEILSDELSNDISKTDNDFSIVVNYNSVSYELADYNNTPMSLGTVLKDTSSEIKFTINGYNNIVDISSTKYVEIYLGDDVGIKYKIILNVDRNSPYLIDVNNSIVAGSYYKVISSATDTINITNNSSFTAQYNVNYDSSLGTPLSLNFSNNFPVGSVIKMIDITGLSVDINENYNFTPSYYYYKVESDTSSILLTDFVSHENNDNYILGDTGDKKYIFVADFIDGNLLAGNFVLSLKDSEFNINVENKREFYITSNNSKYILADGKMDVNITISDSLVTGTDSAYQNSIFGLKISFDGEIPPGTYIEMGEKIYLLEDSNVILNTDNYFLIPLGNIEDISDVKYTLHSRGAELLTTKINHSLVNVYEPLSEEFVTDSSDIEIYSKDRPAMKLEFTNGTQLISSNTLSNVDLIFNYIDYDDSTNFTARLYLLEKSNGVYFKEDDLIENVTIDGESYNPVQGTVVFSPVDLNTKADIKLNLIDTNLAINKTYRVVIETNHLGETKYQEVINFIVIE